MTYTEEDYTWAALANKGRFKLKLVFIDESGQLHYKYKFKSSVASARPNIRYLNKYQVHKCGDEEVTLYTRYETQDEFLRRLNRKCHQSKAS